MWWPFQKNDRSIPARLAGLSCDISVIYSRLSQHERFINYESLELIHKIDKRVSDLENILKSCNITVTIIDKD